MGAQCEWQIMLHQVERDRDSHEGLFVNLSQQQQAEELKMEIKEQQVVQC